KIDSVGIRNGGLIGTISSRTTLTNSYYDGVKTQIVPSKTADVSRLTTAMKTLDNYEGWDFEEIWTIQEGESYPYLRKLSKPSAVEEGLPEEEVAGGKGTAEDPYIIMTKDQLNNMRYEIKAYYRLGNDIDLDEEEWEPVGNSSMPFSGTLDGNGYSISNLHINKGTVDYVGLMAYTNNADFRNIKIDDISVSGKNYVGALVGYAKGVNLFSNICIGSGEINATSYIGGLAGLIEGGNVEYSSTEVNIVATSSYGGGLIGHSRTDISKSVAFGKVAVTSNYAGGLVGYIASNNIIAESYATGDITGNAYIGGLVGRVYANGAKIENCFALGKATGRESSPYTGGLLGQAYSSSTTAPVNVNNCYSAGIVNATGTTAGGLIGQNSNTLITSSYFDSTNTDIDTPEAQAKDTSALMDTATLIGWDFDEVWDIEEEESYPFLRVLPVPQHDNMPNRLNPVWLKIAKVTSRSVELTWKPVPEADYYDISLDGEIIATVEEVGFLHADIEPGKLYQYRVRARNNELVSSWTPTLKVITLLDTPDNVRVERVEEGYKITWDDVYKTVVYDIEINGIIVDSTTSTSYIHTTPPFGSQNIYRIRARNHQINSRWSSIQHQLHWIENLSGVSITAVNWVTDTSKESEVEFIIKAKGEDIYTILLDLVYDPRKLKLIPESMENLVQDSDIYYHVVSKRNSGRIKILISRTGDIRGKNGELDLIRVKFSLKSRDMTKLEIPQAKLVNSYGEYISIQDISSLNVRILPEFELFQEE
ncbi:The GLUG motif-containing protein, partial [Anaerovirgula multivorans]